MKNLKNVRQQFDSISKNYDEQRRKLIPCFDDFYGMAIKYLTLESDCPSILDLGAGTGLLSQMALDKYDKADLVLIDAAPQMLEIAKSRLQEAGNVQFIVDDYTKREFTPYRFDAVISSLSIHHLEEEQKYNLYSRVYNYLKEDGVFINADQVYGETSLFEKTYHSNWKNHVENSGLEKEAIASAFERLKLDKMTKLSTQIKWLIDIGFNDVDVVYKYHNFCVITAVK